MGQDRKVPEQMDVTSIIIDSSPYLQASLDFGVVQTTPFNVNDEMVNLTGHIDDVGVFQDTTPNPEDFIINDERVQILWVAAGELAQEAADHARAEIEAEIAMLNLDDGNNDPSESSIMVEVESDEGETDAQSLSGVSSWDESQHLEPEENVYT